LTPKQLGKLNSPKSPYIQKDLPRGAFTYDEDNDCYTCPAGKTLEQKSKDTKRNIVIYRGKQEDCLSCALSNKCTGKTAKARHLARCLWPQ
jgi:hypothetical protein